MSQNLPVNRDRSRCQVLVNQDGIALITVLLLLITITVIGIAALTVTGLENRMAGFSRSGEAASTAAEACVDTGMQVIMQTLDVSAGGTLPETFKYDPPNWPTDPRGPVPTADYDDLNLELIGQMNNYPDTTDGMPATFVWETVTMTNREDLSLTLNNYSVKGDIDRLYVEPKTGTSQAFDEAQSGSAEIVYRVDCVATNSATGTSSRITGIFACTLAADGCQRAL